MECPQISCSMEETTHLLNHICTLELNDKISPSPQTSEEIRQLSLKLSSHLRKNFNFYVTRFKMNGYSQGNQSGKLLASQYKCKLTQTKIPYMTDTKGNWLNNPLDMATCFRDFYVPLYNLHSAEPDNQPSDQMIVSFFSSIHLPILTPDQITTLSQPFTAHEINKLIGTLPLHKAPGSNGFCNVYYKEFRELLVPHLCDFLISFLATGNISKESLKALVVTIPKPNKPHDNPAYYMPISLLNTDIKLYAYLLALHLMIYL